MSQCLTCKKAMSCTLDWKNQGNLVRCTAYVQPVTNADRIRAMNNEELAKFIDHAVNPPEVHCIDCKWDVCWKCWKEWLEKEVTNEDEYEWRELEDVQQL